MYPQGKWTAKSNTDGSWVVMSGNIVIATFDRKDFPEWNEANAQLIAAAPTMLDELKQVVFLEKTNMTKKQVQLQIDRIKMLLKTLDVDY